MGIAATIAGLVQEAFARGYNVFAALRYVDDQLLPGIVIPEFQVAAVAAELFRRMPAYSPEIWEAVLRMELPHRISQDAPPQIDGAGLPAWTWAAFAFGGMMVLYLATGRRT